MEKKLKVTTDNGKHIRWFAVDYITPAMKHRINKILGDAGIPASWIDLSSGAAFDDLIVVNLVSGQIIDWK